MTKDEAATLGAITRTVDGLTTATFMRMEDADLFALRKAAIQIHLMNDSRYLKMTDEIKVVLRFAKVADIALEDIVLIRNIVKS